MFYIYLIKSEIANWVYVGSTANLEKRLAEHNRGDVRSTKYRRPYRIVYSESFDSIKAARAREKQIKAKRTEKEAILRKLAPSSNG